MMLLKFYLNTNSPHQISDAVARLPDGLRPTHFTHSEGQLDKRDLLTDHERYTEFLRNNPLGFLLVGQKCEYDVSLRGEQYSTLFVDVKTGLDEADVSRLFLAAVRAEAEYGFAATDAEYIHRNRIVHTIGENVVEAWVGRDLKRYVPGVYWRTLLSEQMVSDRDIDFTRLPECISVERCGERWFVLKVAGSAEEWPNYAEDLDSYCHLTDALFSIKDVQQESQVARDYLMLTRILGKWK
jgi:hypothetical protein